jgi:hypothetical protein
MNSECQLYNNTFHKDTKDIWETIWRLRRHKYIDNYGPIGSKDVVVVKCGNLHCLNIEHLQRVDRS